MIIVMKTTLRTGARSGTVTRRKTCHSPAPSVRAASRTSRGIAARPAPITTIAKPAQIQMYAIMSDGVIKLRSEPAVAAERLGERLCSDRGRVRAAATFEKSNVPSELVVADCTFFPAASRNSTVTPGRPSSCFSTTPALPPPGLKSRQTVPVTSPGFGEGATACFAPFGTCIGRDPGQRSSANRAGVQRRLEDECAARGRLQRRYRR